MNTPKFKTKNLLAALAASVLTVEVEGFGPVCIRQVTVAESDAISAIAAKKDAAPSEFGLQLLIRTVVDEDGAPLFDDEDLPALRVASSNKVDKLVSEVMIANGYKKAAEAKN